jgi:hypothetical protein
LAGHFLLECGAGDVVYQLRGRRRTSANSDPNSDAGSNSDPDPDPDPTAFDAARELHHDSDCNQSKRFSQYAGDAGGAVRRLDIIVIWLHGLLSP